MSNFITIPTSVLFYRTSLKQSYMVLLIQRSASVHANHLATDIPRRGSARKELQQGSPVRFMGTFERTSAFLVSMVTHAVDASLFTGHNSWTNTIDSDKWRELLDECHGAHESLSFWNAVHWMIGRWFVCMDVQQVNDVSSWFLQTWKGTLK